MTVRFRACLSASDRRCHLLAADRNPWRKKWRGLIGSIGTSSTGQRSHPSRQAFGNPARSGWGTRFVRTQSTGRVRPRVCGRTRRHNLRLQGMGHRARGSAGQASGVLISPPVMRLKARCRPVDQEGIARSRGRYCGKMFSQLRQFGSGFRAQRSKIGPWTHQGLCPIRIAYVGPLAAHRSPLTAHRLTDTPQLRCQALYVARIVVDVR